MSRSKVTVICTLAASKGPIKTELDDDGAATIAAALRLASRVYRALADAGFISPNDPHTQRAIAAPNLLAQKIEYARELARR